MINDSKNIGTIYYGSIMKSNEPGSPPGLSPSSSPSPIKGEEIQK